MTSSIVLVILVTSFATYLSRFLGVVSSEKIKETIEIDKDKPYLFLLKRSFNFWYEGELLAFQNVAYFDGATFQDEVFFRGVTFQNEAAFRGATFQDKVFFNLTGKSFIPKSCSPDISHILKGCLEEISFILKDCLTEISYILKD